jgi:hypothetical protein
MNCIVAVLAIILAPFGLAGCATSSAAVKLSPPIVAGKPVSLDFILVNSTNALPGLAAETAQLQDALLSGLRETGVFANVNEIYTNAAPGGGIRIQAAIKQITRVSETARVWYGGFAGKAQVVVQVAVSDLATGKPIEVFEAEGHTGAFAKAGTTSEAIQKAAAGVVDEIARLNAQTAKQDLDSLY